MQSRQGMDGLSFSELFEDIKDLIRGSWRFRWYAIALAWAIGLGSWWYVLSLPDQYEAQSRLYIDTEDSLQPLLRGMAIQSNLLDDVQVMLDSVLSRPTLEKIAQRSGFDIGNPNPMEVEALIKRLGNRLNVSLDKNQILRISIEHSNPEVAYAVVDVLIDMFVTGLLGTNRSDTASAQAFLVKKLAEYESLLSESETRLAEFKKRNVGQMPGQSGGYYARLQTEMEQLRVLESQYRLAKQRQQDLELQMAGEQPVFGMMTPEQGGASSPQIAMLQAELNELRLIYTESHPDVAAKLALIEQLRANLNSQPGGSMQAISPADLNPVYQQLRLQYSQAGLELSQLTTQRADQAQVVSELRQKIDTIPEIEAELTRLNRSYDVYKAQHSELLARLEQARLTEDAEASSSGMKFRVIDPTQVSSVPVGPNRTLFMTFGLVFALAFGAGVAVFCTITSPVLYSSAKLERMFGTPVLGTIKRVLSPEETAKARVDLAVLSFTLIGLLGVYGALLMFDRQSVQLVGQLMSAVG